jgi:hypothetical protein
MFGVRRKCAVLQHSKKAHHVQSEENFSERHNSLNKQIERFLFHVGHLEIISQQNFFMIQL